MRRGNSIDIPRGERRILVRRSIAWLLWSALVTGLPSSASAETPGESRFFADCPRRRIMRVHDEARVWDLHAFLYTALGLSEVEIMRTADWVIDLPLPGAPLRPFRRTMEAIRAGYHRLPPWNITQRVGELVSALQIPELSFGDATATYSVATGSTAGPGSGMIMRVYKLIDWTQHVTGDLNEAAGGLIRRPQGAVRWSFPGRAVDGAQALLLKTFNHLSVWVSRGLDGGVTVIEVVGEHALNLGRQRTHQEETVFLRLPIQVYRAHELWILEHRSSLVLGDPELFWHSTHAALAHQRPRAMIRDWSALDVPGGGAAEVVIMTTGRVMARAPSSLRPYVVPAAWILDGRYSVDSSTSRTTPGSCVVSWKSVFDDGEVITIDAEESCPVGSAVNASGASLMCRCLGSQMVCSRIS